MIRDRSLVHHNRTHERQPFVLLSVFCLLKTNKFNEIQSTYLYCHLHDRKENEKGSVSASGLAIQRLLLRLSSRFQISATTFSITNNGSGILTVSGDGICGCWKQKYEQRDWTLVALMRSATRWRGVTWATCWGGAGHVPTGHINAAPLCAHSSNRRCRTSTFQRFCFSQLYALLTVFVFITA